MTTGSFLSAELNTVSVPVLFALARAQKLQFLTSQWDDGLPARLRDNRLDLDIYYKALTKERAAELHAQGIEVNVWTCDDPAVAEELIRWGVDYITSNILE